MERARRRPTDATLRWVERQMGRGAHVVAWRRMTGGLTASVHRLTVELGSTTTSVVLRRWLPEDDRQRQWAAADVTREANTLAALEKVAIPAPRLIAAATGESGDGGDDDDGRECPAVLMTRVPGSIFLAPSDRDGWIGQMAAALARIHDAAIEASPWVSWMKPSQLAVPEWSAHPASWRAAIAAATDPPANPAMCFIHRDYQHFNMLWSRERLCGVIDWPSACTGPPDIDVGHCRLNLSVLFSPEWSERFRLAYEAETGRMVEAVWDITSLLSYNQAWKRFIPFQVAGRAPVDVDHMDERIDELLALAVARL